MSEALNTPAQIFTDVCSMCRVGPRHHLPGGSVASPLGRIPCKYCPTCDGPGYSQLPSTPPVASPDR